MKKFFYFLLTGIFGFITDFSVFTILTKHVDIYLARTASFMVAVNVTYYINNYLTFREFRGHYMIYVLGQTKGFLVNFFVFSLLLIIAQELKSKNIIAFIGGSTIALIFNFLYAKYFAFMGEKS